MPAASLEHTYLRHASTIAKALAPGSCTTTADCSALASVSARDKHRVLGRARQALESAPVLTGPLLHPSTQWATDDSVQLASEDLSLDPLLKLSAALGIGARPSLSYIARLARFDVRHIAQRQARQT